MSKNVSDCYSMDLCAYGFETQSRVAGHPVSHFLTPPAQRASRCSFVKLGPSRVAQSTLNKKRNRFLRLPMPVLYFFLYFPKTVNTPI